MERMISLNKLNDDDYRVLAPGINIVGDYDKAVDVLRFLNVDDSEIDIAMSELEEFGRNRASFGVNRCVVYSEYCEDMSPL